MSDTPTKVETPAELAERLVSMKKPVSAFVAPANELTDNDKLLLNKEIKPVIDVDPSMDNLIKEATRKNDELAKESLLADTVNAVNNTKLDFDENTKVIAQSFQKYSNEVLRILKEGGMDTQQAEKAHTLLMKL